ncbi:MAG: hypothetical protein IKO56_07215 [Alphaproteobacteria bacterium]|nr:hypothetical protein [Alphaproteobacteria bacterium]
MKLIVLYGPKDSGKTTTLKVVYEKLKKKNVCETNWFAYYDSDRAHLDFRDVLVFPYTDNRVLDDKNEGHLTAIESILSTLNGLNDKNTNSFNLLLERERKKEEQESQKNSKENKSVNPLNGDVSFPSRSYSPYELEEKIQNLEKYNKTMHPKESDYEPVFGDDLTQFDCYKVGFVLEGDFGFVHTNDYWAKNNRNLYRHLTELIHCNTIICACSEFSASAPVQQKPLLCIAYFVIYCFLNNIPIQLFPVDSIYLAGKRWATRNVENEKIANQIIKQI